MAQTAPGLDAATLAERLEGFLAEHPEAAVIEDGRPIFRLATAHYAVSESHGRCLLQLWSEEANLVRTVVELRERGQVLRLVTRRMGTAKPQTLELVPSSDRRSPSTRETVRRTYQRLLTRVLEKNFFGWKVDRLRSAMDLEHSFGPSYVRGRLLKGTTAEVVVGVGAAETRATIDGALTLGLLWLTHSRNQGDGRRHFGALKLVVPAGSEATTAERIAWLKPTAARFELYTLDEQSEELVAVDYRDRGNARARLTHAFSPAAALERCREGGERLRALLPSGSADRFELRASSPTEVGLFLHGLECARVRRMAAEDSFALKEEISFGTGPAETPLTEESEPLCRRLLARLAASRRAGNSTADPLYRLQPERWMETELRRRIVELLPELRPELVYEQVPAMATGDRGLFDLLGVDRNGRLAVIELKAEESMQLPLQALDYWIRVRELATERRAQAGAEQRSNAFARAGYFPEIELADEAPRLILIAPALRIHPANEIVLGFLSSEIDWELIALSEYWREELKAVFRKRGGTHMGLAGH